MSARRLALVALIVLAVVVTTVGVSYAAFSSTTSNPASSFSAHPDWTAPSASPAVVLRNGGGVPGFISQGATYRVYANVTDSGNPLSGTATVTADVSSFDTGVIATPLYSGSWTVAGQTYNYRSNLLTANAALVPGLFGFSLGLTDNNGTNQTQNGFSVEVDNTAPSATNIQTTNVGGGTQGRPETGDTVIYTFSEPMDPTTIKANWDGTSTAVTANFVQAANDRLTTNVNLGTVDLRNAGWVTANASYNATMVLSGSTLTMTLGTLASGSVNTVAANVNIRWTPVAAALDRAGNAISTAQRTETGAADPDF